MIGMKIIECTTNNEAFEQFAQGFYCWQYSLPANFFSEDAENITRSKNLWYNLFCEMCMN